MTNKTYCPDFGYLYVAMGAEHRAEAQESCARLRAVRPDAHVTIVTTKSIESFDRVFVRPPSDPDTGGIGYKVDHLSCDHYRRTMFVDTDTYFVDDCTALFHRVMLEADMALMQDPAEPEMEMGLVPYNTGVVLMDQNERTQTTLTLFRDYYRDPAVRNDLLQHHPARKQITDQPAFMAAVRDTQIKIASLPSNYNFRYRFPVSVMGKVKLIHGPKPECGWEKLANKINASLTPRVWAKDEVFYSSSVL